MTSILTAGGQLLTGGGQAAAYQANSQFERQQAEVARQQSYVHAAEISDQVARTGGAATAAFGGAGVSAHSGSALLVLNDIASEGEMSRQLALYQGRVNAVGHQQQADIYHAQASAARLGSYIGAGTTLINGALDAGTNGISIPGAGQVMKPWGSG